MCEKFNSGLGGYICDQCRVLLWAGRNGSAQPEKRKYIYSATAESIVALDGNFYCSEECATKGPQ
jgi:hypothetical protein